MLKRFYLYVVQTGIACGVLIIGLAIANIDNITATDTPLYNQEYLTAMGQFLQESEYKTDSLVCQLAEDGAIQENAGFIWFPQSGSLVSICIGSGCVGSLCFGSGCGGSGCSGSGCAASVCVMSACGGSGCMISACGGSACVGSICLGTSCQASVCVGSACAVSACVNSNCGGSACYASNCGISGCSSSGCVSSGCTNSGCSSSNCEAFYNSPIQEHVLLADISNRCCTNYRKIHHCV